MANKVGNLIKKARTEAGLTQEQLAKKVKNTSASDISKAERGELKLSQEALKQIAKATGVTQKSLLDAAVSSSYKNISTSGEKTSESSTKSSTKKTSSTKSDSSAKKTSTKSDSSAKSSSTKKSSTSTKKTSTKSSSSGSSMKVSSTERKLVELYRAADSSVKKKAMEILKENEPVSELQDTLETLIDGAIDFLTGNK